MVWKSSLTNLNKFIFSTKHLFSLTNYMLHSWILESWSLFIETSKSISSILCFIESSSDYFPRNSSSFFARSFLDSAYWEFKSLSFWIYSSRCLHLVPILCSYICNYSFYIRICSITFSVFSKLNCISLMFNSLSFLSRSIEVISDSLSLIYWINWRF